MSVDIYTKAFKDFAAWWHALKLMNMLKPCEFTEFALLECVDKRYEIATIPSDNTEDRAGWFKNDQHMNSEIKQYKK